MVSIMKLGIGGAVLFIFGILLWYGFPGLIRSQIKKMIALKPGSIIRDLWTVFPFPLDFKIYMFNITNPDEIKEGKKPKVQEVGPFFYNEYREKFDLVDREEEDTVEYGNKVYWHFNPKSKFTGEEILVFPHLMILGMVAIVLKEKPTAIGVAGKAIDSIFHKPESIFVTAKAKDILFDGLPIDCNVKDVAGTMVCNLLKIKAKNLLPNDKNRYMFSLLGWKNNSEGPERVKVLRGIKNYKDVGRVVKFNGKSELKIWPEHHCNVFTGTDSIMPPLRTPEEDIVLFGFEFCRSFSAHFERRNRVKGINTFHYSAGLGDMSNNPMEKCYCPTPETCLPKNIYDLTKCLGIPLVVSLPHFYDSDGKYLEMVDGLHPDQDKHEVVIDLEPMTIVPIHVRNRVQFNMFIQPTPKLQLMKNYPEALLPLCWIDEGLLLETKYVIIVKMVFIVIAIINFLIWLMILGGIGMCGAAGFLYYKKRSSGKLNITKIIPKTSGEDNKIEKRWPPCMTINTITVSDLSRLDKNWNLLARDYKH